MADIKKELNDIKNAVYGREVRGSIHDGIKKINDEVENATDLSESAKHQVENIQQQVNQLVVEGDSSVEAAQARVDAEGKSYPTLKARLDEKETQFSSQLAQTTEKLNRTADAVHNNFIDVMYPPIPYVGAKGDGTDDSHTIENLLNTFHKIYLPDGAVFTIEQPMKYYNQDTLEISGRGMLKPKKDIIMLELANVKNISLSNMWIDGSNQNSGAHTSNALIRMNNVENVSINRVFLKDGSIGIVVSDVENYTLSECVGSGFRGWAFTCGGDVRNTTWKNNISYNNEYDGLKMSGQLYNVTITGNLCFNNGRDGYDFAGHSVDGLRVFDNIFNLNGVEGVEVKTLSRDEYPVPPNVTNPVYLGVEIYNNQLKDNGNFGVAISNQYSHLMPTRDIFIHNNKILNDRYQIGQSGMRIANFRLKEKGDMIIHDNIIRDKFDRGIRLLNCDNVIVRDNDVEAYRVGIELEVQVVGTAENNLIENNVVESETSNAIRVLADCHNNIFRRNKTKSPEDQYRIFITSSATGNKQYLNEIKDFADSSPPTGRATQGEIAYSSDVMDSGCIGWVASETGSNVTWRPFGQVT